MSKLGLVLEGGGMHGIYTAGMLNFFIGQNLYTDSIIGVSAGACHACNYVSKQIGRAYRTNTVYLKDKRYMGVSFLLKTGDFFGAKFVYEDIPNTLDPHGFDAFNTSHTKLYAVASNLKIGKAEYLQCINMKHDVIYVRASAPLPLLSRIVEVDGKKLLDGGTADNVPIHKFQEVGYIKNIVVLTQYKEYCKGRNGLLPTIRRSYKKYLRFIRALETRYIAYSHTPDELALTEKGGSVFLMRPSSPVEIPRLEKSEVRLRKLYEQGYMDAKNSLEGLKSFIVNEN